MIYDIKNYFLLNSQEDDKKFGDEDGYIDDSFEPWQTKRTGILSKYTTSEKLSITTVKKIFCTQVSFLKFSKISAHF